MAYTWDEFPFTNTANFESVARTALEQWRLNCAAETAVDGFSGLEERADGAESRLTDVEAGTGITALDGSKIADASLSGDKLIESTVEERHLEIGNGPTDNYLLSWNASVGILVWTAPGAAGTDTYQVKDDAADAAPGYLEDKVAKYLTRKNLLINPNMAINQEEYLNGSPVVIGDYIYDMWLVQNVGSISPSVSASGESITVDDCVLETINDDIISASGGNDITVTVSVVSGSLTVQDGISQSGVVSAGNPFTYTLNTSGTRDGKLFIGLRGSAQTFSGLKLEVGSTATQYEIPQVTEEELKCYRYYYRYPADGMFCLAQRKNLAEAALNIVTPVPMKSPVTISVPDYTACYIIGNGTSVGLADNFTYGVPHGCNIIANGVLVLSSLSLDHIYYLYTDSPQYLELDARY